MKIPNQVIPESQKTKSFIEKTIKAIVYGAKGTSKTKNYDYEAWMLYNEQFDDTEIDYMRKVGTFTLPAKFRWIGVQRPRINLLASQESKRPWVYTIRVGDMDSKKKKIENKTQILLEKIKMDIFNKKIVPMRQMHKLQSMIQQIEGYLQREPETEAQAKEQQKVAAQLPEIKMQVQNQMESLQRAVQYTEKDTMELDIFLRMTYQEKAEWYAQVLADKMRQKLNMKEKKIEGFIAKAVTGKPIYYVDYCEGKALPDFENLDDVKVYYPKISNIDWIQDGPWVAIEEVYSPDKVIGMIGKELSKDEIKKIEDHVDYHSEQTEEESKTKKMATLESGGYEGSEGMHNMIRCWRVFFKSPRQVYIKKSPNPYKEGHYFRKFITEEDSEKVGKKYKDVIRTDKGDDLEIRYVTDIYEGFYVEILEKAYKVRKKEYCRTFIDDYTKKDLPVYGPSFSRLSKKPYSLIKSTEELQKLINILHYHRELLLALAGTKGTVIDLSQIPPGMSPEEHQYHKKKGQLYIQTVSKGGRKINSSFNQWQQYDETLSPAIQYLDNMIHSTDQMIGYMMGIGPQRMGQVVQGDQVGKTEMSIQQNALVTEILYYEHDQVFKRAFEAALNLATKYCAHEGGVISREDSVNGDQTVYVPKGLFANVDLEIMIENSTEEETALMELKQLAVQKHLQGQIPFSNVISLYRIKALKELEKKMEYFEEKAMEAAQAAESGKIETMGRMDQQKAQIENEFKMVVEQQKAELEAMSLELDKQKFEFEQSKVGAELELRDKEMRSKMATEIYKAEIDQQVEVEYLAEQQRQALVDEKLREVALKVDIMMRKMELDMDSTKQAYDVINDREKIKVDARKAAVQNKKKIKD